MAFYRSHILISMDTPSILAGAKAVREEFEKVLKEKKLDNEIKVVETGSLGISGKGTVIIVYPSGVYYANVLPKDVKEIVNEHILKGRFVERLKYKGTVSSKTVKYSYEPKRYTKQKRIVLRNVGMIDPENIEEYIARDGYEALGKALSGMKPKKVIDEVLESRLVGRGGAGFPTGRKWQFTAGAKADIKYIICNADEGEPGTFKDRLILEGDPHKVIEGMLLAGYAVGASMGYIYIRGEYALSIERIKKAIEQAYKYGLLGKKILSTDFSFDLELRIGAGAYICGEETALIESIEGKRGEPRHKPPFPPVEGLWGKPTIVNNVETLANVPEIILNGGKWYSKIGTPTCAGTKVFTMIGNLNNTGLIEIPMGITLREVIYDIGEGIKGGGEFLLAQTGGTTGGILTEEHMDVPMAYDSLREAGSGLGSGALLVVDKRHCVVDLVKTFVRFFKHESCGKCTICREGTGRLREITRKIAEGRAKLSDIDLMKELAENMKIASFCGLGQAAPTPILGCLKYFMDDFVDHIKNKRCKAGVCTFEEIEEAEVI